MGRPESKKPLRPPRRLVERSRASDASSSSATCACRIAIRCPASDDLRWVQTGSSRDNVAITTFQVRRSTVDPIGYALLIEVQNFSDAGRRGTRLKLELDESLVDVIPLSIEPNDRWRTTIEGTSREGGVLQASIDVKDGLRSTTLLARSCRPGRWFP